jgi:putative NIF3 family GTP cyclohydrolase 1 type 2
MTDLSRREFAALAAYAVVAPAVLREKVRGAAAITAQDVVDRIKRNIGVEWKTESVDGVKAGDPATVATGVVTTSMATLDVLQRAVKAGSNVVITGHPTFYSRGDARVPPAGRGGRGGAGAAPAATADSTPPPPPPADRVFTAKNEFIDKNRLVVFRLSEHWRLRTPDPLAQGIASALGWTRNQSASDLRRVELPGMTLEALTAAVKQRLQLRGGMRVIGDPRANVRRVGLLPGSTPIAAALKMLPEVDVILAGEVREWESAEYARDKAFAGEKKGLVLVGRVASEEPGMNACAEWLKGFVTEVPVRHVPAGDAYWSPSL